MERIGRGDFEPALLAAEVEKQGGGIAEIYPFVSGDACRQMYEGGDLTVGCMSVGQGIGLSNEVKPVAEVLAEMMEEARRIHAELAG